MKTILIFLLVSTAGLSLGQEETVYKDVFEGDNIYVINRAIRGDKYCIKEYSINGTVLKAPKENAFEVDLKKFVKLNEEYQLIIYHRKHCKPRILSAAGEH